MDGIKKGVVANFQIAATQYLTLKGIFYGSPVDAFSPRWTQASITEAVFMMPRSKTLRKFSLYYIGEKKLGYKQIEKMIEADGLSFVFDPHVSILVSAMRQLDKQQIVELGICNREIVLAGKESFKIGPTKNFFAVKTIQDVRLLSFSNCDEKQSDIFVLVEKIA